MLASLTKAVSLADLPKQSIGPNSNESRAYAEWISRYQANVIVSLLFTSFLLHTELMWQVDTRTYCESTTYSVVQSNESFTTFRYMEGMEFRPFH